MELILDIVYHILLRLSAKTLVRFQCVCKQWLSFISDPTFQQDHCSQQNPLLIVTDFQFKSGSTKSDINSTIILSTYNHQGKFIKKFSKNVDLPDSLRFTSYTVDYCKVLLCITPEKPKYNNRLFLCNPSTEELISLPLAQEASNFVIGINYSAYKKELKVVRFFCRYHSDGYDELFCETFTLGASEWREAKSPPVNKFSFTRKVPFLHGAFHLLPSPTYDDDDDDDDDGSVDDNIHVFDVESEEYTKITLPKCWSTAAATEDLYLDEFGGSLFLNFDFKTTMELWFLKDYHAQEWVKEYTLDLNSLGSDVYADLLNIMNDGRMLMGIAKGEKFGQSLYCYNPWDKSVKQVTEYVGGYVIPFVESFLSLGNLS